ncbi:MAG: DUF1573 domain-containing protein [Planctomycetota bacterium]
MSGAHGRRTRGITSSSVVALVAAVIAVAAIAFAVGLMAGRGERSASPDEAGGATGPAIDPAPVAAADPAPSPSAPPAAARATPLSPPPLRIEPASLDFGRISPGQVVSGSVQLHNTGSEPLTITQTRASCKCTSIDLANTVIAPGASVPLAAELDPGYALGRKSAGVKILIEGYSVVQVDVRAEIAMAVRADPPYINAYRDVGGTLEPVESGTVTVLAGDGRPFRVLGVNGEPAELMGLDPAADEPRTSYELRWDLSRYDPQLCTDADGNLIPTFLAVETDHPECGVFDIQVRHPCTQVRPPSDGRRWLLSERRILVGALAPGESREFSVKLVWLGHTKPNDTIRSVTSETDQLVAELVGVDRVADEIRVTVRVTATPDARGGLVYDNIRLHAARHSSPLLIVGRVTGPDGGAVSAATP